MLLWFQSPSNRVKCSDHRDAVLAAFAVWFQSPSNRVKCSDKEFTVGQEINFLGFNPLAIGSNVLINNCRFLFICVCGQFQSPSNRVKCSDTTTYFGDISTAI